MMGTSIEVQAFGGDEATRRAAIDEAFAAFAEIDRLMSNYRDDSELARPQPGRRARRRFAVSDPMFAVLDAARRVSAASNGAFDVTVGPLVRLWGFHDKTPHIPTDAELAAVRPLVDYRDVLLDAEHHTVRFARPGVELDLGGIAKGFAVEIAAGVLRRKGPERVHRCGRQPVSARRAARQAHLDGRHQGSRRARPRAGRRRDRRDLRVDVGGLLQLPRGERPALRPHPRSADAAAVGCNR